MNKFKMAYLNFKVPPLKVLTENEGGKKSNFTVKKHGTYWLNQVTWVNVTSSGTNRDCVTW